MKTRLEIIEEVYGKIDWSAEMLAPIVRCMEITQDETRKQMRQSITDPEKQSSQYGTVQGGIAPGEAKRPMTHEEVVEETGRFNLEIKRIREGLFNVSNG